jgi:hypothetical protein
MTLSPAHIDRALALQALGRHREAAEAFEHGSRLAGDDPYAYKGTADISRPYSRPDKDGGCDR